MALTAARPRRGLANGRKRFKRYRMCGIFGFIARRGAACDRARFQGALTRLFKLSEPRGREASGLVIANNGTAQVFKRGSSPSRMLRSRDYGMFLDANLTALDVNFEGRLVGPVAVIGHCRLVTAGTETFIGNNQPIIANHSVGVHNGIVTNDAALWERHPEINRELDTDSEVNFRLIDRHGEFTAFHDPNQSPPLGLGERPGFHNLNKIAHLRHIVLVVHLELVVFGDDFLVERVRGPPGNFHHDRLVHFGGDDFPFPNFSVAVAR